MWNASFLSVGCSILDDDVQVSRDERLSKTQTVLEVLPMITVFQRLGINVTDLM